MTGARRWHALEVVVPPGAEDLAAACLWEHPLTGVEEGPEGSGCLVAFAEEPWDAEAVRRELLELLPAAGGEVHARAFVVEEEDWLARWKAGWTPTPLGQRLVVAPAWWAGELPPGRAVVRIDPGLAFGTGTHESTALAWELLEAALAGVPTPGLLVDVGTGTGVLALGAVALAPRLRALATEADGQALLSLRTDLALNDASDRLRVVRARAVPLAAGAADLLVANLTAAEHRAVDAELSRVAAPAARVILSGFLRSQVEEARKRWRTRGFALEAQAARGEWRALRLGRA